MSKTGQAVKSSITVASESAFMNFGMSSWREILGATVPKRKYAKLGRQFVEPRDVEVFSEVVFR